MSGEFAHGEHILERAQELERLRGAMHDARSGRGSLMLIEGPAGIGKTSLLEQVAAEALGRGMSAVGAGATESRGPPLELVIELLRPLVAQNPDAGGPLFEGAVSVVKSLFGERAEVASGEDVFALVDGLSWLCTSLAERQPLLLAVDDVQWADSGSIAFIEAVARSVAEQPICIVATVRTGEPADGLGERLHALAGQPLRPAPLSGGAAAQVVRLRLGAEASDELCAAFAVASGGNPLLLRELVRAARAEGIGAAAGPDAVASLGPSSIRELVDRRLRRCSPAARALAPAVAVLGSDAILDVAARVSDLDVATASAAWQELESIELAARSPPGSQHSVLAFRHPVLRRAAYRTAGRQRLEKLHQRAARELADSGRSLAAASQLMSEYATGVIAESWAVETLLEAARASARRGGREQAIEHLDRVLAAEPDDRERRGALRERGRLAAQVPDPVAIDDLRAALELAVEPCERARIALELGSACFYLVRLEEAADVCRVAATAVDGELALQLEAQALNADRLRGASQVLPGDLVAAVSAGRTAGERAVLAHVASAAVASGEAPAEEIRRMGRRAWDDGRLLEEVGAAAPLISFLGTTLSWAEDYEATFEVTGAQLRAGQRRRSPVTVSYALALSSGTRLRVGDLAGAEAESEQVVSALPASDPLAHMISFGWLLESLVARGRVEEAVQRLDGSGLTGPLPDLGTVDFLLLSRGDVKLAAGDAEAALADYLEVGERAGRSGYFNPAGLAWRSRAARAYLGAGEAQEARRLAGEETDRARAFGAPRALGIALRALASASPPAERVVLLREAVGQLEESEARLQLALARTDLGTALIETADTEAAQEPLGEGMHGAHLCGATPLVERAMTLLRETGMRPRRPALRGRDALTARQLQIAQLASEGLSNREIAEALFLTMRAVELHLTGAYRKLGIDSREKLAGALAAAPHAGSS